MIIRCLIKKISPFFFLIIGFFSAQIIDPVHWEQNVTDLGAGRYKVSLKAKIDAGWHLYSQSIDLDAGVPTTLTLQLDKTKVSAVGKLSEIGQLKDEYSRVFKVQLRYFSDSVTFEQTFQLHPEQSQAHLNMALEYQVCNDRLCLSPRTEVFDIQLGNNTHKPKVNLKENKVVTKGENPLKINQLDLNKPLEDCAQKSQENSGLLQLFILGFLGGLLSLLTPCVFPMIPLTVSFFTQKDKSRQKNLFNALFYGFSIILIYSLLSLPFYLLDDLDPEIFNKISTSAGLNLFFFFVFLFFALSFFGWFDLSLPSGLINKVDRFSYLGGLLGVFFMAITLALVSFSCTGPILGSLLAGAVSSSDGPNQLTAGMLGFGSALALPFTLFALFPSIMNKMPKSGVWMVRIKVILGFIELALALKFLSKADLSLGAGILKREIFIGLWILISMTLTLYLLDWMRFFRKKQKQEKTPLWLKISGFFTLLFTLYLVLGLTPTQYANLRLLSGFPPPLHYSIYGNTLTDKVLKGIKPILDYKEAQKLAKKENKPILIDFTGWNCENCRRMEENVWTDPTVNKILKENLVLASLYVDERTLLSPTEQISVPTVKGRLRTLKTVGDKWAYFQTENFKRNAQPHYILITSDGQLLTPPVAGYMSLDAFKEFLNCGLGAFNLTKKK